MGWLDTLNRDMTFEHGTIVYRLRAALTDTGYGGKKVRADWNNPDELEIPGAYIGPASTTVALAAGREQASESVSLFCEGEWDVQQGDRIRNGPDGAALYTIEGIPPEAATNPFTGWQPPREIPLIRYLG